MPGLVTAFRREEQLASVREYSRDAFDRGYRLGRTHAWQQAIKYVQAKNRARNTRRKGRTR